MPFTPSFNINNRYIEVAYTGAIHTPEIKRALATRASLAREYDIQNHLIECSKVDWVPEVPQLCDIADHIPEIIDTPIHKVALVIPRSEKTAADLLLFVVKAYRNGIKIDLFNNHKAATDWLTGTDKSWLATG